MEIRLVTLPIEVEVTRIEGKADDVAAKNDGHSGDGGDELEGGEHNRPGVLIAAIAKEK
jgi:hypothetical protein